MPTALEFVLRHKEPTNRESINAYDSICTPDRRLMRSRLEAALAQRISPAGFDALANETMGFLQKEHQKRYFNAMYRVLVEMVDSGTVERFKTPLGYEYMMTEQAIRAHSNETKKRAANFMRKDVDSEFQKFVDSSAFTDSGKFLKTC